MVSRALRINKNWAELERMDDIEIDIIEVQSNCLKLFSHSPTCPAHASECALCTFEGNLERHSDLGEIQIGAEERLRGDAPAAPLIGQQLLRGIVTIATCTSTKLHISVADVITYVFPPQNGRHPQDYIVCQPGFLSTGNIPAGADNRGQIAYENMVGDLCFWSNKNIHLNRVHCIMQKSLH
jgi:hypothetical protein